MSAGRVIEEFFFDRVPVEAGHGAQPAGDGGPGAAAGFQVAGEAFDVGAAGTEQAQVMLLAPAGVLAQVQLISLAGQAAVSGQESGERQPLGIGEYPRGWGQRGGRGGGHRAPPGFGLRPGGWASRGPSKRREPHGKAGPRTE